MRDEGNARHEAAHAVVAAHLGVKVLRVVLAADTTTIAKLPARNWCELLYQPKKLVAFATALSAGYAWDSLVGRKDAWYRGSADFRVIAQHFSDFTRHDRMVLVDYARHLLSGPLAVAHDRVTRALLESDLSGRDVSRIMRDNIDGA